MISISIYLSYPNLIAVFLIMLQSCSDSLNRSLFISIDFVMFPSVYHFNVCLPLQLLSFSLSNAFSTYLIILLLH